MFNGTHHILRFIQYFPSFFYDARHIFRNNKVVHAI